MAAEAQKLFDLIDTYWFTHQIFKKSQNPPPKIPKNDGPTAETNQHPDFSATPTINISSCNDQLFFNSKQQSLTLESVVNHQTPKLETIFSGKESKEIKVEEKNRVAAVMSGRKRRNNSKSKSKSKSLSELEFEELKGFMDLGFMFSEKDKDSKLVSIIPGLQRLGKDVKEVEEEKVDGYVGASRPYLSEAWDDMKNTRELEALKLIKISAVGDETVIKNQLRVWAHSIASIV